MHKKIKVAYARPPTDDIRGSNLYVANLPRTMTQEELTNLFTPYGEIVNVKILMDSFTGLSKGRARNGNLVSYSATEKLLYIFLFVFLFLGRGSSFQVLFLFFFFKGKPFVITAVSFFPLMTSRDYLIAFNRFHFLFSPE